MDDYGNNSLSGFQQTEHIPTKKEYEKSLLDVLRDKWSKVGGKHGAKRSVKTTNNTKH